MHHKRRASRCRRHGSREGAATRMQGNCTTPPPADLLPGPDDIDNAAGVFAMLPLRQGQCLLLLDSALLATDTRLWLDGLYLRVERQVGFRMITLFLSADEAAPATRRGVWLTDVTIQGDNGQHFPEERGLVYGLQAVHTPLLAQGAPPCGAASMRCRLRARWSARAATMIVGECSSCIDTCPATPMIRAPQLALPSVLRSWPSQAGGCCRRKGARAAACGARCGFVAQHQPSPKHRTPPLQVPYGDFAAFITSCERTAA